MFYGKVYSSQQYLGIAFNQPAQFRTLSCLDTDPKQGLITFWNVGLVKVFPAGRHSRYFYLRDLLIVVEEFASLNIFINPLQK